MRSGQAYVQSSQETVRNGQGVRSVVRMAPNAPPRTTVETFTYPAGNQPLPAVPGHLPLPTLPRVPGVHNLPQPMPSVPGFSLRLPTGPGIQRPLPTGSGIPSPLPMEYGLPLPFKIGSGLPSTHPSGSWMPPPLPMGSGLLPQFPTVSGVPGPLPRPTSSSVFHSSDRNFYDNLQKNFDAAQKRIRAWQPAF